MTQMKLSMKQKQTHRGTLRTDLWLPKGERGGVGGWGLPDVGFYMHNAWTTRSYCVAQRTMFSMLQ